MGNYYLKLLFTSVECWISLFPSVEFLFLSGNLCRNAEISVIFLPRYAGISLILVQEICICMGILCRNI